ncbi:hypothetical protein D3C87_1595100 [compost metagenome]
MRLPRESASDVASNAVANCAGSSRNDKGERLSCPAITDSSSATSRGVRPIGPSYDSCFRNTSGDGPNGTRPADGRMPYTLQNAAGLRSEPPKSLPSATGSMRAASAAAAPPLLPPAVLDGS